MCISAVFFFFLPHFDTLPGSLLHSLALLSHHLSHGKTMKNANKYPARFTSPRGKSTANISNPKCVLPMSYLEQLSQAIPSPPFPSKTPAEEKTQIITTKKCYACTRGKMSVLSSNKKESGDQVSRNVNIYFKFYVNLMILSVRPRKKRKHIFLPCSSVSNNLINLAL